MWKASCARPGRPELCRTNPNAKTISNEELAGLMQEVFAQGGMFRFLPTGTSMQPMLYERRDAVLLCSPDCAGLCPRCGKKKAECVCPPEEEETAPADARLAILKSLLN